MIVLAALALAASSPVNTVETLERMYQQSCSVKAYGSYDDICNGLRKQLKEAQKRQKQEDAKAKVAAREQPASATTATAAPALGFAPAKN